MSKDKFFNERITTEFPESLRQFIEEADADDLQEKILILCNEMLLIRKMFVRIQEGKWDNLKPAAGAFIQRIDICLREITES